MNTKAPRRTILQRAVLAAAAAATLAAFAPAGSAKAEPYDRWPQRYDYQWSDHRDDWRREQRPRDADWRLAERRREEWRMEERRREELARERADAWRERWRQPPRDEYPGR